MIKNVYFCMKCDEPHDYWSFRCRRCGSFMLKKEECDVSEVNKGKGKLLIRTFEELKDFRTEEKLIRTESKDKRW